jgi:hypothetical protein
MQNLTENKCKAHQIQDCGKCWFQDTFGWFGDALKKLKEPRKAMTCEEFYDLHFDNYDNQLWMAELKTSRNFSTWRVFEAMCKEADEMGIKLTDKDDFEFDEFFEQVKYWIGK